MGLRNRDVVSIREFTKPEISQILEKAKEFVPVAKGLKRSDALSGKVMSTFFIEPSTRTRMSFESAIARLGGSYLSISGPEGTSLQKGETLADTIRMADCYSDVIVLRHPQEGAARMAAMFSDKPVINAGDGAGQHPTQTMLDLFTIQEECGTIQGKEVVLMGDLKYGRTVHSLSYALALFGAKVTFLAPPELQMPPEVGDHLASIGARPGEFTKIDDVISSADVLYVTRIQKERFPDETEYQRVANSYQVNLDLLARAKKDLKILHPLPRVNEISPEVDATPNALYFKQAFNGVPVRMAILWHVLEGQK